MKKTAIVFGSVIVGNYLAERFVLKANADDPTGFVQVAEGIGMDDVARAAVILLTTYVAEQFTKRMG
jgi:hypothetical protein